MTIVRKTVMDEIRPGLGIGHYEIVRLLGRGGMGREVGSFGVERERSAGQTPLREHGWSYDGALLGPGGAS